MNAQYGEKTLSHVSMIGTISFLNAVRSLEPSRHGWQDYGRCVRDSEQVIHVDFLSHGVTNNAHYYNNLLLNVCHWREDLGNCQRSSYCMTMLVHIWQICQSDTGNNELGDLESPSLGPWLSPQQFSLVWTNESASRTEILNWRWSQT
jgi:hypothetical protein